VEAARDLTSVNYVQCVPGTVGSWNSSLHRKGTTIYAPLNGKITPNGREVNTILVIG
jgi:hypothetical protein